MLLVHVRDAPVGPPIVPGAYLRRVTNFSDGVEVRSNGIAQRDLGFCNRGAWAVAGGEAADLVASEAGGRASMLPPSRPLFPRLSEAQGDS